MSLDVSIQKAAVKRVTEPGAKAAVTAGQPTLLVSTTSSYGFIYNDKGSGADMDVTIYRPNPSAGYYIIGDYAQGNYNQPSGISEIVSVVNDDPNYPLLKPPVGYNQVWTDKGSGGDMDGSIWYPVPPDGYVTLGFVGQNGYDTPNIPTYRCVRKDLVEKGSVGNLIWSDKGSGADEDVSLYAVQNEPGIFVAQGNYNPFTGIAYTLIQS